MLIHIISGRPQSGKTRRIIEEMNCGASLLFSLENPEGLLRERGLNDSVLVKSEASLEFLGPGNFAGIKVVGLDSLELLDKDFNFSEFCSRLEGMGVNRFIATCHLRRDQRLVSEPFLTGLTHTIERLLLDPLP